MLSHSSHVQLFVTLWTVAHQTLLSMRILQQEYWSGLPCPLPGRGSSQPSDWTCISYVYTCFKFSFCLVHNPPSLHSFPLIYNFLPFSPSVPPHSLKLRGRVSSCIKLCPTNDILFVHPLQSVSAAQAGSSCMYLFACLSHPWSHSFNFMYLTPNTTLKIKEVKQISE